MPFASQLLLVGSLLAPSEAAKPPPKDGPVEICFDDAWVAAEANTLIDPLVRRQAQFQQLRKQDRRGFVKFEFDHDASTVRAVPQGFDYSYKATLAGIDVQYRVSVRGELRASFETITDRLVIDDADEVPRAIIEVKFGDSHRETRTASLPLTGRFEFTCDAKQIELRRLRGEQPGARLMLRRDNP